MILPHDLRARHIETVARMAACELAALALPPTAADRLGALLAGLLDATAELRAELAPTSAAPAQPHECTVSGMVACQVIDMQSRKRLL